MRGPKLQPRACNGRNYLGTPHSPLLGFPVHVAVLHSTRGGHYLVHACQQLAVVSLYRVLSLFLQLHSIKGRVHYINSHCDGCDVLPCAF